MRYLEEFHNQIICNNEYSTNKLKSKGLKGGFKNMAFKTWGIYCHMMLLQGNIKIFAEIHLCNFLYSEQNLREMQKIWEFLRKFQFCTSYCLYSLKAYMIWGRVPWPLKFSVLGWKYLRVHFEVKSCRRHCGSTIFRH